MDGVVREVNVRILGRSLSLVNADDSKWKINQLLLADDMALVVNSEKKLC